MKWLTFRIQRTSGFRFNLTDLVMLFFLLLLSLLLHIAAFPVAISALPLYVGLSFFLFCNVFRIGNAVERIWYIPFTFIAIWGVYAQQLTLLWWGVILFLEPLKWMLILHRVVGPNYVGIGYQRLSRSNRP